MKKYLVYLLAVLLVLTALTSFSASVFASTDTVEEEAAEENVASIEDVVVSEPEEVQADPEEVETEQEQAADEQPAQSEETPAADEKEKAEQEAPAEEEKSEEKDPAEEAPAEEQEEPEEEVDEDEEEPEEEEEKEEEPEWEIVVNPDAEPYLDGFLVEADANGKLNTKLTSFGLRIPGAIGGVPTSTIVSNGFSGWTELTVVVIPANITYIGDGAFANCPNLRVIILEDRLDGCELSLGSNWSGNARVIYGLTMLQKPAAEQEMMVEDEAVEAVVLPEV